ncbi:MAG: ATP-binding protein [Porphyromonadaceae bacterium]|nr:ATP-binding protein [Porphyromonadaceae bacterium]
MKIRTILTLKITCVTVVVFLLCMGLIYWNSERMRSQTFFQELKDEAITEAYLFLEEQVDVQEIQSIYSSNKTFFNELSLYTDCFELLYQDVRQKEIIQESKKLFDDVLHRKEVRFYTGKYQCIGLLYRLDGNSYVILAAAYDEYGRSNLAHLWKTLSLLFVVGVALLFVSGYFLVRISLLRPIQRIVDEAESITAPHLEQRLPIKNQKDELGELCTAFNALLERLETSFNAQKMFISNVSHELRTPLATLIAGLDLCLQKERSEEQYREAIRDSLQDAQRMTKLIDGLLYLAEADYQKEQVKMQEIRLDELLLDVREFILRAHPEYHIELLFGQDEADDDRQITVTGNFYLLNIAFSNLMENNCKYSANNSSLVQISFWDKWSIVYFSDNGSGMTETDKQHLFTLFYRGEHHKEVEGHGIGMALVQKIIHLHQGSLAVYSQEGEGTTFVIKLPHV